MSLSTDGFVVIPKVLTSKELSELRLQVNAALDAKGINKAGGTVLPNAAAEAPDLSWIFCHPGILSAVRQETGLTEMVFTMEADLHRNYLASQWHKDTGEKMMDDGYFGCDPFVDEDCCVYKVALYLQDHMTGKGSLHVRPGSIRTPDLSTGDDHPIRVGPGDMVLFDVRITHRGVAPSLVDKALLGGANLLFRKDKDLYAARLRSKKVRILQIPDRMAVYFAFGAPNAKSEQFAQRNMRRQLSQLGVDSPGLPDALVKSFSESQISTVTI